jgi:hypothetical protein
MLKVANGGTAAREASDVAVNPAGVPSGSRVVTTATPAAWRRNACLKDSRSSVFGCTVRSIVSGGALFHDYDRHSLPTSMGEQ